MIKSNYKKQTFEQGAFILLFTAILTKLIGALFKIPLSSDFCLGDLGFGYFSIAYDLISPIILLSVSGLPIAVSKVVSEHYSSKNTEKINKVFCISRKLFLIFGIALSLISLILIASFTYATDTAKNSIYCYLAIIPSFAFCCLSSAYRGYFEGLSNMITPSVSSLIEALSKLILGFSFAFFTIKLTNNAALAAAAALCGITLGTFFSCIYLHISYKNNRYIGQESKKSDLCDKDFLKRIVIIALPIALYSFSGNIIGLIDSITVRWQLSGLLADDYTYFANIFASSINEFGKTSGELIEATTLPTFLYGIRSKAYTLYNIVPTLTAFLGVSAVPHISMAFKTGDKPTLIKNCCKLLKISAVISFPAGIGFIALNKEIMFLIYGESNSSVIGGKMLLLFGIASALSGISVVMGNILQAVDNQNSALKNVVIGVTVKVIFNLLLCGIPALNIYGSVISTVLCFIIIFTLNIISVFKTLDSLPSVTDIFIKPIICSAICGAVAFAVSLIGESSVITVLSVVAAVLVYVIFTVILKVFTYDEIAETPVINKILKLFYGFKAKKTGKNN